jgi:hypothetical protein
VSLVTTTRVFRPIPTDKRHRPSVNDGGPIRCAPEQTTGTNSAPRTFVLGHPPNAIKFPLRASAENKRLLLTAVDPITCFRLRPSPHCASTGSRHADLKMDCLNGGPAGRLSLWELTDSNHAPDVGCRQSSNLDATLSHAGSGQAPFYNPATPSNREELQ